MNCDENNQIAFSDVGLLTHVKEISFSLTHARTISRLWRRLWWRLQGGNCLLSAGEKENMSSFYLYASPSAS